MKWEERTVAMTLTFLPTEEQRGAERWSERPPFSTEGVPPGTLSGTSYATVTPGPEAVRQSEDFSGDCHEQFPFSLEVPTPY